MKHSFTPSIVNVAICATCKKDIIAHSSEATCDCCDNVGPVEVMYGNILMCESCQEKEAQAERDRNNPEIQKQRVSDMNAAIEASRAVDNSIQVRTDLFNAATVSIVSLKAAIDNDDTIANKPYELAKQLKDRFLHFKQVVFEMQEKIVEAGNQQKAIQQYLNTLANSLRVEEREKLKIQDIQYQPKAVKSVAPKPIKTRASKKLDKTELKKYASELGVNEFTLQMLVVSKGITVEQAANMLRKSINEAKSESN